MSRGNTWRYIHDILQVLSKAKLTPHQGGFVIGSLGSDASWCHVAAENLGAVVVNVDYRMAPEFPHPIPATDCYAALKWALANASELNIDTARVSIGGGSAGGNLAAVCSLMARDDPAVKHNLVLQLLIVPCIDARYIPIEGGSEALSPDCPYESYKTCEFAPCLPLARMVWFYRLWLGTDVGELPILIFASCPTSTLQMRHMILIYDLHRKT